MSNESNSAVSIKEIGPGILQMTLDQPGSSANVLSEEMFAQIDAAMEPLMTREDVRGLVLSSAKPKIFVAGADLKQISAGLNWPDERIIAFSRRGRGVMEKFSRAPFMTVAAIHGACVGGGFEIALWCDARIATGDRRTVIGLPEVKLGLIPGWAGTVRVARIAGPEPQLDLVTSGRLLGAGEAQQMGIIDEVATQDQLLENAIALIEQGSADREYLERRANLVADPHPVASTDIESLRARYTESIEANRNRIHPNAPRVGLEHMLGAFQMTANDAYESEAIAFAKVWGSPSCNGLLNHFFLGEHNRRHPGFGNPGKPSREINRIGIVGAGIMGHSIAAANLARKKSVIILDADSRFSLNVAQDLDDRGDIRSVEDMAGIAECDLVIECVTENAEVKRSVLQQIESAVAEDTLIATNTSAIRVGSLAQALEHPGRFCGIHFCHPELMSLVEVISGPATRATALSDAVGYVRSLGKMVLCPSDRAGFVVNRMLASLLDGAIRQLGHGQTVEQIDGAMREFGFQGGPFEIMDVIGIETCLLAGRSMFDDGIRSMTASPVLPRMVKMGRRGRKSLKGFYRYADPRAPRESDPETAELVRPYVESDRFASCSAERTALNILSTMVLEATHLIDENIVADYRDIDVAVINGFGFPAHQGGILFWADQAGMTAINQHLEELATLAERLRPSAMMKQMASDGRTFYH